MDLVALYIHTKQTFIWHLLLHTGVQEGSEMQMAAASDSHACDVSALKQNVLPFLFRPPTSQLSISTPQTFPRFDYVCLCGLFLGPGADVTGQPRNDRKCQMRGVTTPRRLFVSQVTALSCSAVSHSCQIRASMEDHYVGDTSEAKGVQYFSKRTRPVAVTRAAAARVSGRNASGYLTAVRPRSFV